jgi:membrane protein YqaA with SNARE-associated domain
MSSLSLIYNYDECITIIKHKIYNQPLVTPIIKHKPFLLYLAIMWLTLHWGCYPIAIFDNILTGYGYWLILGILSSIGLGTGLQTGVLFVLPEVISRFNQIESSHIMHNITYDQPYDLIYKTYFDCISFVLIWGIGTALGELPPYWLALTVDIKDKHSTSALFDMLGDNKDRVKGYIDTTVYYLKRYSFLTILGLSAWPNALFDMCGVASGLVRLPMSSFLIPTIIGKAFIKTPIQLGVILYSYGFYGDTIMSHGDMSYIYMLWMIFIISCTLYFIKGAIENVVNSG